MQIEKSCFVITGGASGLGGATATQLAALGGKVVIADLNEAAGTALASQTGGRFVKCNVTSEADGAAVMAAAVREFGGVHGLVNCAGIGVPAKVLSKEGQPLALATFNQIIQVNLVGSFNMLRLAAAEMLKNAPNADGERGVIINTASIAAYDGQIGQPAYAASKAGVVGMTLPIAREFARSGIRVCTIAPGLFETPMMAQLPQEARDSLGRSVPFPSRLGRPEEYASLARQIIENAMFNGETIRLDGALRMAPK